MNELARALLQAAFNEEFAIPDFNSKYIPDYTAYNTYTGIYSADDFPMKITVTVSGEAIFAQATGQGRFPLKPESRHRFSFDAAGIVIVFDPAKNTLTLQQGGGSYTLQKEKN